MGNKNRIELDIASVLRKIGNKACLAKASILEHSTATISTLNLRNLALSSSDVMAILNCLKQNEKNHQHSIRSISFSYNALLGDAGAVALATHLPKSLHELGLVNCGIGDAGGIELLNWMKQSTDLKMVCIEQNHFSEKLKIQIKQFGADHPKMLLVV